MEINVTEVSVQTDEKIESKIKSKEVSLQIDRDIDSFIGELADHCRKHRVEIGRKDSQLEILKKELEIEKINAQNEKYQWASEKPRPAQNHQLKVKKLK